MWESRSLRFPRAVGAEGNLLLVFLGVHGPSFPPPSSCDPFLPESAKQHLLLRRSRECAQSCSFEVTPTGNRIAKRKLRPRRYHPRRRRAGGFLIIRAEGARQTST